MHEDSGNRLSANRGEPIKLIHSMDEWHESAL